MFWFLWPWSIWDLSSLTRDQTCTPALEGDVLPAGSPEKSLRECSCTSGSYDTWIRQNCSRISRSSLKGQAPLVAQTVKNLPAMQETWVWSLGRKDPLEKGMATYSSVLAWRIPWTEESGSLQSIGSQRVELDWGTNTFVKWIILLKWLYSFNDGVTVVFLFYRWKTWSSKRGLRKPKANL